MPERLQKILAQAGYGSRRACEDFITAGRVRVNGQIAQLGQKADPVTDKITVDGKPIAAAEILTYIALYKPRMVLSAAERERGDDRQTVRDLVEIPQHVYPVGRLDFESEGLVLMTNDGDLTNKLTHPKFGHDKEYRVLLRGVLTRRRWIPGEEASCSKMDIRPRPWIYALKARKEKGPGCG
jgi:23S rRNA pseudouridine2605 synthase